MIAAIRVFFVGFVSFSCGSWFGFMASLEEPTKVTQKRNHEPHEEDTNKTRTRHEQDTNKTRTRPHYERGLLRLDTSSVICYRVFTRLAERVAVALFDTDKFRTDDAIRISIQKDQRTSRTGFGLEIGIMLEAFKFRCHFRFFLKNSTVRSHARFADSAS
jgi:hypothetical protein